MKTILGKILIPVMSTLFACALLEGAARVYEWSKDYLPKLFNSDLEELIENKDISENTFNIYYLGGSTMMGEPFLPTITIPRIVEYIHDNNIQGKEIRTINIAWNSKDLQFNYDRLRRIVANKDIYHPSLIVIYSGHNEFIEYHHMFGSERTYGIVEWLSKYSLLTRQFAAKLELYKVELYDRKYFDEPLLEEPKFADVIQQYKETMDDAVELLSANNIPVIVSTVAGNYADWEPNRSIFCSNENDKDQFEFLMTEGRRAEKNASFEEAIVFYEKASQLCDSFAETHYRKGKADEALKQHAKASEEYFEAVDYDGMPIRSLSVQNNFIRGLNGRDSVFVVDVVKALEDKSDNGLIGFNLMMDAHHPNQKGYFIIGDLIGQKIKSIFHLDSKRLKKLDSEEGKRIFNIRDEQFFYIYIYTARWFYRMSTWRHDPTERLNEAEKLFVKALKLNQERHEPYTGLAMVHLLRNDMEEAKSYLSKAKMIDAESLDAYLNSPWIRTIIKNAEIY